MCEFLCALVSKCYQISTTTDADVFFEYFPHVNTFTVYVCPDGWTPENAGHMEYLAQSLQVTKANLLSTIAKLFELESKLEVK